MATTSAPIIRFARSGNVDIAYQVVGDGPVDLVFSQGSLTHLEVEWELPAYRNYCERLGEFTRLILFDKRGMGMSDRVPGAQPLEERMDDIRAVMDAVGSERAALLGESEGGPLSILFAAAHPERTRALILQGAEVRERKDEEWPWGESTPEEMEAYFAVFHERYGKPKDTWPAVFAPSLGPAPWFSDWLARVVVNSATPNAAEAFIRMAYDIDVREVARTIKLPTLILHAVEDRVCNVENARWLARNIEGSRYVELPGGDHIAYFQPDRVIAEIREFLTGQREADIPDRVLATVLFTDIVGSTERAAREGDRRWAQLVDLHHAAVRGQLARFRGTEIDTAGDGFFARFDGPARAIRCALGVVEAVRPLGLEVRAGVHTGELEVVGDKPRGISVNLGARVASLAAPGEVLVSQTVRDLVAGSGLELLDRGTHELKGIPGEWKLFAVAA
ncbi:MAG TPA: adenylate/guanylate cyclase domain-containing protein [Candidatus Limnocylindrales bacterium]